MASKTYITSPIANQDPHNPQIQSYPVPLSPPLPPISKPIELNRALSASSRSSLFKLTDTHIVFEDEHFIVVNKPQGIYCESILSSLPRDQTSELHLANRLDRDTSGLMVITKSHKVAGKLVKAFTEHKVKKTYIALCLGSAPNWKTITVKSGHGRSKFGMWRVYALSNVGRSLPGGSVIRDMTTKFEVLTVNKHGSFTEPTMSNEGEVLAVEGEGVKCGGGGDERDEVLIRAYPKTGRTHQIRLHCQYLGIPIRGDVKYEGVHECGGRTFDGHSLHAESLVFTHPITGVEVEFRAPFPHWATQN
ncbi:hypothetical protein Sjap_006935 [Stephania japonica]|uniref:Pseudouridine synthase RsuA/RluA-like domain-containing protein n=1 Tax=Stephania japonica TaxID=461633 RepID=A0AAP0K970_9MAGN